MPLQYVKLFMDKGETSTWEEYACLANEEYFQCQQMQIEEKNALLAKQEQERLLAAKAQREHEEKEREAERIKKEKEEKERRQKEKGRGRKKGK